MTEQNYTTPENMNEINLINPPPGGWKPSTYYIIDVTYSEFNPIHKALFYTGFLDGDGNPGSYNGIFVQGDKENTFKNVYYIKAIAEVEMNAHNPVFMKARF